MISINNVVIYFLLKLNESTNSLRLMKLLYIMVRNSTVFGANYKNFTESKTIDEIDLYFFSKKLITSSL